MNTARQLHWDVVYREKTEAQTSWYRAHLDESLRLINTLALPPDAPLLDVGGGRATLVDDLLARGFRDVSVLDLSEVALAEARRRLGTDADKVRWIAGDVTEVELPVAHFALWHDRAVFHFLIDAAERARYVAALARAARTDGHALIATFATDGPERCSGLPVCRYDEAGLAAEFAPEFELIGASRHVHLTPDRREQPFTYVVLRRRAH
ncbi:MAG TPA: class I SAM-dependent methyltransferase [Rudaea sp.]|jgi:SAM-dependent methyltransferase|uniref:class I SAM-dependent methyltransferase n=1 Tax=Rudaea sp. TaxID=2136325 RepID=UPI002F94104B